MKKRPALNQPDLFVEMSEERQTRRLLDQLLADARLYRKAGQLIGLLQFVSRLRNVAPFNAMLLHIQRPAITYVASQSDWATRFGRDIRDEARPLIILHPFGPIALVYDILDTDGSALPEGVLNFTAKGDLTPEALQKLAAAVKGLGLEVVYEDVGDSSAGSIRRRPTEGLAQGAPPYQIRLNANHPLPVQFATLAHELGHLYLGHLGGDPVYKIEDRRHIDHVQRELEAEMVAYVICSRTDIKPNSDSYLSKYVAEDTTVDHLDLYCILKAMGRIEGGLGLERRNRFTSVGQGLHR